jgi:hypothetical protein
VLPKPSVASAIVPIVQGAELPVVVFEEHLLAAIAAQRDVVWITGQHETRETSHGAGVERPSAPPSQTGFNLVLLVNCHRNCRNCKKFTSS